MGIKESLPLERELEDLEFVNRMNSAIGKMASAEDSVGSAVKELFTKIDNVNTIIKELLDIQKETERQYIQFMNTGSKLLDKGDLAEIRKRAKNSEERAVSQRELTTALMDVESAYREHAKTLKRFKNSLTNLNKAQSKWHKDSSEFTKLKNSMVAGGKLGKVEKSVIKDKEEVIKLYKERFHQENAVELSYSRISQAWQKVKGAIKNTAW